ncbi:Hsp20/alpha crystallin family protein [Haloarcula pellucida]|nr:Hsp20/alpha crystallin family protein [Halomicroarcula pellucida]MBX0347377.1 Hsp20/alpha crystallin family protein [Halomicroarcula pellucida]
MTPRRETSPSRRRATTRPPTAGVPFPVDVVDHGDEYFVAAELPGIRKQDVDVTVWRNRVRIVADADGDVTEGTYLRRERGLPGRSRVVHLPEEVEHDAVEASYDEDGVLRLTLRKRTRRRRVDVS